MRARVAELLGVEFPICAFSHCRDVAATVSDAGGLGILGAVAHSSERLQTDLTWIEEQTGGKPYGVDLLLPPKYVGVEQGGIDARRARALLPEEHRAFVDDLLARYGIAVPTDEQRLPPGGGLNISPKGYKPLLDVAFAHKIRLIASALGPPPLRTAWTDEWERPDSPQPLGMPLQSALIGDPQLRINQAASQPGSKARELATSFVGQVVGSLDKVRLARAVVLDMVSEFIDTVERLEQLAGDEAMR